ncbi:MAG: UDP-phosphate N-acetylglucosaminyl 1-phosphate transferase, partial [Thiobacillus sp.]
RSHYYQRVVRLGASHRRLALAAWALMLTMAALGFLLRWFPQRAATLLILSAAIYLLIFFAIDRRWRLTRNEV